MPEIEHRRLLSLLPTITTEAPHGDSQTSLAFYSKSVKAMQRHLEPRDRNAELKCEEVEAASAAMLARIADLEAQIAVR